MKPNRIEMFVPSMPGNELISNYVAKIDEARVYTNNGPLVQELEARLSNYFSVPAENFVLLANATLALEGAIQTSNLTKWVTPSWSFAATGQALLRSKVEFSFRDVDNDWRVLPNQIDKAARDSGLVDVLPFGDAVNLQRYPKLPDTLLVDGAASFDSLRNVGEASELFISESKIGIVVSFHATKIFSTGEGGAFFSNDVNWVREVRNWSRFGFETGNRTSLRIGTNAKMHEYSAAVGLAFLDILPEIRSRYSELLAWASETSKSSDLIITRAMQGGYISPYWIVRADVERISRLRSLLRATGIATRNWWEAGMHSMPAFLEVPRESLVFTDKLAQETIGLPFHLFLTSKEKSEIAEIIKRSESKQ